MEEKIAKLFNLLYETNYFNHCMFLDNKKAS